MVNLSQNAGSFPGKEFSWESFSIRLSFLTHKPS